MWRLILFLIQCFIDYCDWLLCTLIDNLFFSILAIEVFLKFPLYTYYLQWYDFDEIDLVFNDISLLPKSKSRDLYTTRLINFYGYHVRAVGFIWGIILFGPLAYLYLAHNSNS